MSFGRGYRFSSEDPGFSSTSSRNSNSFPITNSRSLSNLYIMLQHSRLTINNPLTDPVTLPSNVDLDLKIPDFKYNFNVELEIVSKIHDEKKSEAEQRELEAWKALESKKNRKPTPKPTDTVDPHTLVDLNFESLSLSSIETPQPPTAVPTTPSGKSLPSPTVQPPPPYPSAQAMVTSRPSPPVAMKSPHEQFVSSPLSSSPIRTQVNVEERLCSRLVDKGFELSLVRMAIDVIGLSNEDKLLSFLTNFRKLEELPDKFSRSIIGQSLLLFDCDFAKSLELLKEITKLSSKGIQLEDMLMAMGEFDNNVKATSAFLVSFKALKELGFQDEKIKEALMMNGNDSDKALQYILENS